MLMPMPISPGRPRARTFAALLVMLVLSMSSACKREAPATPAPVVEPQPPADFCREEADGDYLNPLSCRSQVICRDHQISELRSCPPGQVINGLSEQRPLRCLPLAESGLNADCSFKPLPLSEALPDLPGEAAPAAAAEVDAQAAAHP